MKIFYEQIKEEGLNLETNFSFNEGDDFFDIKSFIGQVDKAGDAYVLTGVMKLTFTCACDRCLGSVALNFNERITITLSPLGFYPEPSGVDEKGLTDEEAGMYVTQKDHFDLEALLREEALMLPPIKRLCKADCKGFCSICGVSLNTLSCDCSGVVNPKMAALGKLKKDKN